MRNGNAWHHVPGGLTHVTSGSAGVWGVDQHGNIYYRKGVTLSSPAGSDWTKITGALIQIDSGPVGIVYGVTIAGHVVCRDKITATNPMGETWKALPGGLKYVSCGPYGCWGVNSIDDIFFRTGVTASKCEGVSWVQIAGKLSQLEVNGDGNVYGVNAGKAMFVREGVTPHNPTGSHWRAIDAPSFVHVSAGSSDIFGLDVLQSIYTFNGMWPKIIQGGLSQIDHGLVSEVWGVNSHGHIFRLKNDKTWINIPGGLKHVTVGAAGVWGVNGINDIYYYINPGWKHIPGKLKQIDSGPGRIVYGVNSNDNIYCRVGIAAGTPEGTAWKQVQGSLKYVSCGALGCWGVNSKDDIFYRTGVSNENCAGTAWHQISGKLKQIEAGATGDVYGISSNNYVFRRTGITALSPMGSGWEAISYYGSHVTTGLNGQYLLVNGAIFESAQDCPRRFP